MAKKPTNFSFNNGGSQADFADAFVYMDLFSDGGLWNWGFNGYGELGDNTTVNKSSPVQTIAGGTNWKQVAWGYHQMAAIKTDGTLWTCGRGHFGQLGDNASTNRSSPVQTVSAGTNWKLVSCGEYHTATIKTDGTLWLWGFNQFGMLGDNTVANKSSPVQTVSAGSNWKSVGSGQYHTASIKTDNTLWIWGRNDFGALGDNTITNKSSPVQTVSGGTNWKQVGGGRYHTAAIKTDGTLWTWGHNQFGTLGDNTIIHKSSPVQTIAGGTNWKSLTCGFFHTAAIKTDGTLWTWGLNTSGLLGDNTGTSKSSPVQTIAGGTNWKSVSSTSYHIAAIKTDGTLWTWGYNNNGQLGDNTRTDRSSPIQTISAGTNWKLVASGGYHTSAISSIT